MDFSSWGLILCAVAYFSLINIPGSVKTDSSGTAKVWYNVCHGIVLGLSICVVAVFWRCFMVKERLVYTLQCGPPWIM
jgi:hypothetical protein